MSRKRLILNLTFSVDLDSVPGWGYKPIDWIDLVKTELLRNEHYNPDVTVNSAEVETVSYTGVVKSAVNVES